MSSNQDGPPLHPILIFFSAPSSSHPPIFELTQKKIEFYQQTIATKGRKPLIFHPFPHRHLILLPQPTRYQIINPFSKPNQTRTLGHWGFPLLVPLTSLSLSLELLH
jgi:hypothetical protein